MPTPSTLVSRNVVLNTILTFLERIIDEKFWEGLIGQRLVELGKRYFGNDFVVLSLVYYIACKCDFLIFIITLYQWVNLYSPNDYCMKEELSKYINM